MRHIGQAGRVGRVRRLFDNWQRHLDRETSGWRHGEHLVREVVIAGAGRDERDVAPIGRPTRHGIGGRMVGQAPRNPSARGHHVDILIPVVLAAERHLRSIGREEWVAFVPDATGQPPGVSAVTADDPEIPGKAEDDLRPADGGVPEQQGPLTLGQRPDPKSQHAHDQRNHPAHDGPPYWR
jgi:hypothetical protein